MDRGAWRATVHWVAREGDFVNFSAPVASVPRLIVSYSRKPSPGFFASEKDSVASCGVRELLAPPARTRYWTARSPIVHLNPPLPF